MPQILNAENLTNLGWTLLNSIWQMGILWFFYFMLAATNKRLTALARHNLALIFSGLGFAWSVYSLVTADGDTADLTFRIPAFPDPDSVSTFISSLLSVLSVLYLVTILTWAGRYMQGYYESKQNRRRSDVFYPEPLQLFSDRVSTAMHIRKPVQVLLVEWVDTAQTIGFLKPLVLLPVALVNRLSMEQAETILLHELLHIRRNDYLINIGVTIFRALFFFNPFARLFFKTVARERENACDDGVVQWHSSAPVVYAEALYNLEKYRQNPNAFSLAANGDNPGLLKERIRRVTGQHASNKKSFSPGLSFCLVATFCLFIMVHAFSLISKQAQAPVSAKPVTSAIPASMVSVAVKTAVTVIIHESWAPVKRSREYRVKMAALCRLKVPDSPAATIPPAAVAEVSTAVQQELSEGSAGDLLQYAGSNQVRNYSNEKAAEHELPLEMDMNGTPYVPSASFSYMPLIDTLQPDVLRQNKLRALLAVGKLKTDAIQIRLREQVSRNKEDLRLLKKQSQKLIELKQKKLQPELHRIQTDMQIKKEAIKQLQLEMQIQNGEVITI